MKLYFLRHGTAESRTDWNHPDRDRPLTHDGEAAVRCVGKHLHRTGLSTDCILTSPYARAARTAEIAAVTLNFEGTVDSPDSLSPGFGVPELEALIAAYPDAETMMLVGHEPDFSFVISELCGGARVVMKKGAIARVDLDGRDVRTGRIVWLLSPSSLGCHS